MPTFDFVSFRAGQRQMVGTVWPEMIRSAGGGGVFTRSRVEEVAFEELDVPLAVIQPGAPTYSAEWGITNQSYTVETMFHYVKRRDLVTDLEEFVEARLQRLAEYLLYTGPPIGQCLEVTMIDATEGNQINAILLEKNMSHFGGTLSARLLVGHGVT